MEHYSLQEAQNHLQQLIDDAQHGKKVVILDANNRAVQLVPVETKIKPRKAGSARGLVKMSADFDSSLSDFDEYSE